MILFEWHSEKFNEPGKRDAFIRYLASVWENRPKLIEEEVTEEVEQEQIINKQRFFDFTFDDKISARNYVGVVQYGTTRISVFPKIFSKKEELSKYEIQSYQLNILYWLSYSRKFQFPTSIASLSTMHFDDLLESLIYIYADYTAKTLSEQPFQSYQEIEEETAYLKGRLLFDIYLSNNLTTGRWQHFYCSHQPFVYDNLFNRIVKFVTKRLYNLTINAVNKELLASILFILDEVTDISCVAEECDKVKLNPLYLELQQVLNLCKMFLSDQVIDNFSSESDNFCFLLPMEFIFEEFIFGFISSEFPGLSIESQSKDYLAKSDGKNAFQIKNDIYINEKLLVDTKYKIRLKDDGIKAGVSQSDMYQMVSYAIRRNSSNVLLLYPHSSKGNNQPTSFTVQNAGASQDISIMVRSIDISFTDINKINESLRLQLHKIDKNLFTF